MQTRSAPCRQACSKQHGGSNLTSTDEQQTIWVDADLESGTGIASFQLPCLDPTCIQHHDLNRQALHPETQPIILLHTMVTLVSIRMLVNGHNVYNFCRQDDM